MKTKYALYAAMLVVLTVVGSARGEDLRAVMEADNARWLAAYNTNTPAEKTRWCCRLGRSLSVEGKRSDNSGKTD